MAITTTAVVIDKEYVQEMVKAIVEDVGVDRHGFLAKGKEDLSAFLKDSRIAETDKARIYAEWTAQVIGQTIQSAIAAASQLAQANAELYLRRELTEEEKNKLIAETSLIGQQEELVREQTESENKQNEAGGIIDKQKERLEEEIDLLQEQFNTQQKQTDLAQEQVDSEKQRNGEIVPTNGLIKAEIAFKEEQTKVYTGQNVKAAMDGISAVLGMITAADGTPDTSFVQAHSKCAIRLGTLGGITDMASVSYNNVN